MPEAAAVLFSAAVVVPSVVQVQTASSSTRARTATAAWSCACPPLHYLVPLWSDSTVEAEPSVTPEAITTVVTVAITVVATVLVLMVGQWW